MFTRLLLAWVAAALLGGVESVCGPMRSGGRPAPALLAQVRRGPGTLRRIINKTRRMPSHTKLILGLCAAGVVVFFIGVWAKSQL